jgi:molybdopterin adenylyltransferase
MKVAVITVSDRASRGEYEDLSGPLIQEELMERFPAAAISRVLVPDEADRIREALTAAAACDFIFTTGGTGIGPRDITPEVTARFCDRELPGISESIRAASLAETPAAMLSRGYAGMRGGCVVVNFPGSVKAVRVCLRVVAPVMEHALRMIKGEGH